MRKDTRIDCKPQEGVIAKITVVERSLTKKQDESPCFTREQRMAISVQRSEDRGWLPSQLRQVPSSHRLSK